MDDHARSRKVVLAATEALDEGELETFLDEEPDCEAER